MKLSEHKKLVTLLLIIGVATPLIIWWGILSFQQDEDINPYAQLFSNLEKRDPLEIRGDDQIDVICGGPGRDGLSWETAYYLENFVIDREQSRDWMSGIFLYNTSRFLIIRNVCIQNNPSSYGIRLLNCSNVNVTGCGLFRNIRGMWLSNSNNITLYESKFWGNSQYDIYLYRLYTSTIRANEMIGPGLGMVFSGWGANLTIENTNMVNGKPIYYFEGRQNLLLANIPAAAIFLLNCSNFSIVNLSLSNLDSGIHIANCSNVSMSRIQIKGSPHSEIEMISSQNCTIFENTIQNSGGLVLDHSNNITIRDNIMNGSGWDGIYLWQSNSSNISGNIITRCYVYAINLRQSGGATITGNYFCSNNLGNPSKISDIGIESPTSGNTISGNVEEERCAGDVPSNPDTTPGISGYPLLLILTFTIGGIIGILIRRIHRISNTNATTTRYTATVRAIIDQSL